MASNDTFDERAAAKDAEALEIGQVAREWIPRILDQRCAPEQDFALTFAERLYYADKALRALATNKELPRAFHDYDGIVVAAGDGRMDCMNNWVWDELIVARRPQDEGEGEEVDGYEIRSNSSC